MYGIVYKIINLTNGKLYIGQTTEDLVKRFKRHSNKNSECIYLSRAIQKYGKQNFKIETISRCNSSEELNHRETYYIKLFNTLAPNGYNLKSGGSRGKVHSDSKKKMSESKKGKRKPHSQDRKINISKSLLGRKLSEETKKIIIATRCRGTSHHMYGKSCSDFQKAKISEANKGRPSKNRKKVICLNNGVIYDSANHASKALGLSLNHAAMVCRGVCKHAKGFIFKYLS